MSFAAFAIAMAIFPVHTWMLEAQSKASAGVATILSGTMLLLGAYGMMRISLVVFPVPAHYYSFAITGLAVVGAFWGSIGALRQDELRRFIGVHERRPDVDGAARHRRADIGRAGRRGAAARRRRDSHRRC